MLDTLHRPGIVIVVSMATNQPVGLYVPPKMCRPKQREGGAEIRCVPLGLKATIGSFAGLISRYSSQKKKNIHAVNRRHEKKVIK